MTRFLHERCRSRRETSLVGFGCSLRRHRTQSQRRRSCPLSPELHRVGDCRIVRLIQKWLRAGVSEEGQWSEASRTAREQGMCITSAGQESDLVVTLVIHFKHRLFRKRSSDRRQLVRFRKNADEQAATAFWLHTALASIDR
jgi:hypothetical protein